MFERSKLIIFGAVAAGAYLWRRRPRVLARPVLRSLTILASLAEVEFFLMDSPAPELQVKLKAAPGAGTEVHARLERFDGSRAEAEASVSAWLRRMKQLIETGEVARIDERVRAGGSA